MARKTLRQIPIAYKATEIGQAILDKIKAYYLHDMDMGMILRKANLMIPAGRLKHLPDDKLAWPDLYTILFVMLRAGEIKERKLRNSTEVSIKKFHEVYTLWKEGESYAAMIHMTNLADTTNLVAIWQSMTRRYNSIQKQRRRDQHYGLSETVLDELTVNLRKSPDNPNLITLDLNNISPAVFDKVTQATDETRNDMVKFFEFLYTMPVSKPDDAHRSVLDEAEPEVQPEAPPGSKIRGSQSQYYYEGADDGITSAPLDRGNSFLTEPTDDDELPDSIASEVKNKLAEKLEEKDTETQKRVEHDADRDGVGESNVTPHTLDLQPDREASNEQKGPPVTTNTTGS